jgi:hypothetical protein
MTPLPAVYRIDGDWIVGVVIPPTVPLFVPGEVPPPIEF